MDFITSNDFSFYDGLLDTAVLCGIVPKRYRDLGLSQMDTYFAMARGYQGENGDVKALAMKKWFNTNYHYIVPELEDDMEIRLSGSKIFDEYAQARADGTETKPVVTGAYTLLSLCADWKSAAPDGSSLTSRHLSGIWTGTTGISSSAFIRGSSRRKEASKSFSRLISAMCATSMRH